MYFLLLICSREYEKSATFSFGSGRKFESNIYLPHAKLCAPSSTVSPGPVYKLSDTIGKGAKTPAFSQDSLRFVDAEIKNAVRQDIPGPVRSIMTIDTVEESD